MKKAKTTKCAKSAKRNKAAARNDVRTVVLNGGKKYRLKGLTSPSGERWVHIAGRAEQAFVRYIQFRGGGGMALDQMAQAGVVIIGQKNWSLIRDEVAKLSRFPPQVLLEHSGWSGGHFALPDGTVFSPTSTKEPVVLFATDPAKCATAGAPRDWKAGVAGPLVGQSVASFLLLTMFAPPLLELTTRVGNYGFELCGEGGKGKSTLQQVISSVAGGAMPDAPGRYWISCNTTANALERAMRAHSDLPMVMEEAADFAASADGRVRGTAFRELVFHLASGTTKARWNDPTQTEHRFIYIMSTNQSLAELLAGSHGAVSSAAGDRLITIPIGDERPYGIFDFLPAEYGSGAAFAEALKRAAGQNYGLAIRRFMKCLVDDRAEDEAKLRAEIEGHLARFRKRVGVDHNDGSELRVVDAFGLSYAAGMLAKRYKVIPAEMKCLAACRATFELHKAAARPLPSLPERLVQISRREGVVDLDGGLNRLSDSELRKVPAFLHTTKSGRREILFTPAARDRFFPDFREVKREAKSMGLFQSEAKRSTVRRNLRRGKPSRKEAVYRFFLPEA